MGAEVEALVELRQRAGSGGAAEGEVVMQRADRLAPAQPLRGGGMAGEIPLRIEPGRGRRVAAIEPDAIDEMVPGPARIIAFRTAEPRGVSCTLEYGKSLFSQLANSHMLMFTPI
jgi:hypothetical protein